MKRRLIVTLLACCAMITGGCDVLGDAVIDSAVLATQEAVAVAVGGLVNELLSAVLPF
jgi:hypothetical protein